MLINKVLDVDLSIPNSVKEKFLKKKWFYLSSTFILIHWTPISHFIQILFIQFWIFIRPIQLKLIKRYEIRAWSNQDHKASRAWVAEFLTSKSESSCIDWRCFFTWSLIFGNFAAMSLSALTQASLTFGTFSLEDWKIRLIPFSMYWSLP